MTENGQTNKIKKHEVEGTVRVTSKGTGYVSVDGFEDDIEIAQNDLHTALHRDQVRVLLHHKTKEGRQTGEVAEILFRYKMRFVGTVKKEGGLYVLVPDDPKMYADILIPEKQAHGVKQDEKVYAKITKWTDSKLNPIGEVLEIIGKKGKNDVEMKAILLEKGLSPIFPDTVEKNAQNISKEITEKEIASRRDMRKITTFTIDPDTAEDFDDALSIQTLPNGDVEIGIHIADVSHYVVPDSLMDKEAAKRATSIYLVDRTIPMLPETLSNGLCSLNPHEDKLTFSAIFTFSVEEFEQGKIKIVDEWFGKTVIHSNKRFTYEDAQDTLDSNSGEFLEELSTIRKIAKVLEKKRFKNGAIAFETDEVKFVLDENGVPTDVVLKKRMDTNKLIEEFMLLANKRVAEYIGRKDKSIHESFVYRVHDVPDTDRIKELASFLKSIGYELPLQKGRVSSKNINQLLTKVKGTVEEGLVNTAAIRSMAKAVYSTKNIGHFGLSFNHYTHFTSPIRRYPDILVHRLLAHYLKGEKPPKDTLKELESSSRYTSAMEQTATEAERGSIKYKQVEYMTDKVGQKFDGIISGVTKWGLYIEEKKTKAEGLVHIKNMEDDYYTLDEKNYALVGERTKKRFRLGDRVHVKIKNVNIDRRTIDYMFV